MKTPAYVTRGALTLTGALALVIALPASALAAPPTALPASADGLEQTFQTARSSRR
ncbi:hypothetical protein [Streptomyces sp. NPDC012508]|uniref:hypothetical protein n=1 Tax=Streptomyces sp. NPDC012508 TaxID=3364837 RepID=UPI0036ADE8D7